MRNWVTTELGQLDESNPESNFRLLLWAGLFFGSFPFSCWAESFRQFCEQHQTSLRFRGMDDVSNIAKILQRLIRDGCSIKATGLQWCSSGISGLSGDMEPPFGSLSVPSRLQLALGKLSCRCTSLGVQHFVVQSVQSFGEKCRRISRPTARGLVVRCSGMACKCKHDSSCGRPGQTEGRRGVRVSASAHGNVFAEAQSRSPRRTLVKRVSPTPDSDSRFSEQ